MTMPTFTDGVVVHQASLNSLSTGINSLSTLLTGVVATRTYVPTATANINTPHLLVTATDTIITFDVSNINNDAMWVSGQQPFTIQTGGVYIAWAEATWVANATGMRYAHILLNGTAVANSIAAVSRQNMGSGDVVQASVHTQPLSLAPGATLYLSVFQNSGGNLNVDTTLGGTFMSVLRVGN